MVNIPEELLKTLDSLGEEDLKRFQFHLISATDFTCIRRACLENAERHKTVDEMVKTYGCTKAKDITLAVLKKIDQNNLAEELRTSLTEDVCEITPDPNTAHVHLSLSEGNRKVVSARQQPQPYPDHPERFGGYEQVLSMESLTGRSYWEAVWTDEAEIAVTYKGIRRKGSSEDRMFGWNTMSWSLIFSIDRYSVWHNKNRMNIPGPPFHSNRAGVYLDQPAGTLSFYSASDTPPVFFLPYTFHSEFTEPLHAGFRVQSGSSVRVCQI